MRRIQVAIYEGHNTFTIPWVNAFKAGMLRFGAYVRSESDSPIEVDGADLHVFWGMRLNQKVMDYCKEHGQPFICLDHGYMKDRMDFASINLNDLNGLSELDVSSFTWDNSRLIKHGWEITPRKYEGETAIIVGQIHSDKSLQGNDIYAWAKAKADEVRGKTKYTWFKPHPKEKKHAIARAFEVGTPVYDAPMEIACEVASVFHTFSSTTAVYAWLESIDATAHSPMSMIYEYQFKENTEAVRQEWLRTISFKQYSLDEISSGFTWDILAPLILGKAPQGNPGKQILYPLPGRGVYAGQNLYDDSLVSAGD